MELEMKMFIRILIFLILTVTFGNANVFSFSNIASYAKYMYGDKLTNYSGGNELWSGILRDCTNKLTFSCLQKNAYNYLDDAFVERDNITVFDGFTMRRNKLIYNTCTKDCQDDSEVEENLVEQSNNEARNKDKINDETIFYEEKQSPLEEVTVALRNKAVKFLSTRDYEIELPKFFFEGSKIKISPREVDEDGALVRIDFGQKAVENQGRIFLKKIKKFIQNKLLVSFLALLLVIKLVKVKFMFIIPFLFGVGTAKKIFLKLLLFLVPAFAHVFKLCSSYYSSKYHHHHHHKVAHHHHHVPVPVPVPTFIDHHPHHVHHEEEFDGYDYAHPHIQIRKDMDELKEWGIDSFTEPYDDPSLRPVAQPLSSSPQSPQYSTTYGIPQYSAIVKSNPMTPPQQFPVNVPSHGQTLAYSGYLDSNQKLNRRASVQNVSPVIPQMFTNSPGYSKYSQSNIAATSQMKSSATSNPSVVQQKRVAQQIVINNNSNYANGPTISQTSNAIIHEDNYYKPIVDKLDSIFGQLKFVDEPCKERLICSMYKNPAVYSPHSNLVSNELSRDPQELKRAKNGSMYAQRFYRYVEAARSGQEGGDCLRIYPCHINTE